MRDVIRSVALSVTAGLFAAGTSLQVQAEDCSASQASMNQCAAREQARLDRQLNEAYKTQMAWLQGAQAKQALKNAQRQWIAFRDADCLYQVGRREDSGSIWPLLQNQCLAAHTEVRVKQLQAYVACRQDGCTR